MLEMVLPEPSKRTYSSLAHVTESISTLYTSPKERGETGPLATLLLSLVHSTSIQVTNLNTDKKSHSKFPE